MSVHLNLQTNKSQRYLHSTIWTGMPGGNVRVSKVAGDMSILSIDRAIPT